MKNYSSWFAKEGISYSDKVEGNAVLNGLLVLGLQAGPSVHPINLLHEMAHFIDIDDVRCMQYGWGLKIPQTYVPGHHPFNDPRTFQACAREIRVSAIQRVLAHHFNIPFGDYYAAKLIWDWVPGSCYVRKAFPELPSLDDDITYTKRIKLYCGRIMADIVAQSETWSVERIKQEWDRKCHLIRASFKSS